MHFLNLQKPQARRAEDPLGNGYANFESSETAINIQEWGKILVMDSDFPDLNNFIVTLPSADPQIQKI